MNTTHFALAFAAFALILTGCSESDNCIFLDGQHLCDFGDGNYVPADGSTVTGAVGSPAGSVGQPSTSSSSTLRDFVDEEILFGTAMDADYNLLGGPCEDSGICYIGYLYLESSGYYFVDGHIVVFQGGEIANAVAICDFGEWGQDGSDLYFISDIDEVEWTAEIAFDRNVIALGPIVGEIVSEVGFIGECEVEFPLFGF